MKLKIIFTSELKLINYSSSLLQMFLTEALFKKSFRVFHVDPNTASITSVSPTSFSAIFKVPAVALSPSFSCIIQAHPCTVIKLLALKFALYLKKKSKCYLFYQIFRIFTCQMVNIFFAQATCSLFSVSKQFMSSSGKFNSVPSLFQSSPSFSATSSIWSFDRMSSGISSRPVNIKSKCLKNCDCI